MIIRAANPSEAELLTQLAMESKSHWGYSREVMESWRNELLVNAQTIESNPPFVAEIEQEIVAFYQMVPDGDDVELAHMWVRPSAMRQGVGKALVAHAVALAKASNARRLNIDADPNATPFYLACHARRVGAVPAPIAGDPHRVRHLLTMDVS